MTEMEILNQFNTFMISNAIYLAAGFFILWVAFRMVVNIQSDPGAPILNKVSLGAQSILEKYIYK